MHIARVPACAYETFIESLVILLFSFNGVPSSVSLQQVATIGGKIIGPKYVFIINIYYILIEI